MNRSVALIERYNILNENTEANIISLNKKKDSLEKNLENLDDSEKRKDIRIEISKINIDIAKVRIKDLKYKLNNTSRQDKKKELKASIEHWNDSIQSNTENIKKLNTKDQNK